MTDKLKIMVFWDLDLINYQIIILHLLKNYRIKVLLANQSSLYLSKINSSNNISKLYFLLEDIIQKHMELDEHIQLRSNT